MIARALLFIFLAANLTFAQKHVPTIDEAMNIETVAGPQISPNARWVAYTVNGTDFKSDRHPSQIWLANIASGDKFQLTSGPKFATTPRWSPDGEWLAFLSNCVEDENQIFAIRPNGGEALQLSKHDTGVNSFVWSPDGKTIAYTATEPTTQTSKDRDERYAKYEVVRRDYSFVHLWSVDVATAMKTPATGTQLTKGTDFTVSGFSWSPDNSRIAFAATKKYPLLCIIHGGPSAVDRPDRLSGDTRYYPADIWAVRGALILKVASTNRNPCAP